MDVEAEPLTVYRALRHVNPSPYMYFVRMGGVSIVGSSPEMLVRVEGARVETHLANGADHICLQVLRADVTTHPLADWRALAPALS